MGARTRLMLVDEHKVFCECLAASLTELDRFEVTDQTHTLDSALRKVPESRPDLLLLDVGLLDERSVEPVRQINKRFDELKILMLGSLGVDANVVRCLEAGASGYVLRQASLSQLVEAIDLALQGEMVCPPDLAFSMFNRLAELGRDWRRSERLEALSLTPREIEILHLIADGMTNKEIAEKLCLSPYTVKNHVHHILEKLGVEHRREAVEFARRKHWLRPRRPRWDIHGV